jgi:serine/threonine-protein kinase HipA
MSINNKTCNITESDLTTCGKSIGLTLDFCQKTIADTKSVVSNWLNYAEKCEIIEERAIKIQEGIKLSNV